LYEYDATAGQV